MQYLMLLNFGVNKSDFLEREVKSDTSNTCSWRCIDIETYTQLETYLISKKKFNERGSWEYIIALTILTCDIKIKEKQFLLFFYIIRSGYISFVDP